jgi:poly(3-hydroxybutyrate) depolymerase
MGQFIVSVPGSYDANRAYPLGFAFHGYGRTHANCQENDCAGFQSVMGDEAVLVYLKSFTMGWTQDDVIDENAQFFADALAVMKSEYCIDENAVFVAGTSSGATFSNVLACRYGDELLATAPVAGGLPERTGCEGNVAALVIHGIDDTAVPFSAGEEARDFYIEQNGCSATTLPDLATAHGEVRAARDQSQGIHRCVDYQGCDAMHPVRWCEHSEGGYDNSTHGWPLVGGQLIWDFVSSLIAAP